MKKILLYDGTFSGFLCVVFYCYEQKLQDVSICSETRPNESLFAEKEIITTDEVKAQRVYNGLKNCANEHKINSIYKSFLSELPEIEDSIFYYVRLIMEKKLKKGIDFSDPIILKVEKVAKMVAREKHRMDAFVRFRTTRDGTYFATVAPDFNTLPLNATHFKNRYADQKWLLYDIKRKYGLYYDLNTVETITIELTNAAIATQTDILFFSQEEIAFQELWANYFKSINIASRKNLKLHIKHVPKRYWKYLSEKNFVLKN